MNNTYTTQSGDVLDAVCWRLYGREQGNTEALLASNPHLASLGTHLPAGIVINLPNWPPDDEQGAEQPLIHLWD